MKITIHIEPESAPAGQGLTPGTESFDLAAIEAFAAPIRPLVGTVEHIASGEAQLGRARTIAGEVHELDAAYGIGIADLLRFIPIESLLSSALVMLVNSQGDKIAEGAQRLMTPSASSIRSACRALRITDEAAILRIIERARAWGNSGGDVLTEIVKAKAGG